MFIEQSGDLVEEFNMFSQDLKSELGEIRKEIKERKSKLIEDVGGFEQRLTKEERMRLKNSRGKETSLVISELFRILYLFSFRSIEKTNRDLKRIFNKGSRQYKDKSYNNQPHAHQRHSVKP